MAKVDRRLLTVPVGWRDRVTAFLAVLDEMLARGVFPPRSHSLPLDWRKKPLFQLVTSYVPQVPGLVYALPRQRFRWLQFNPHSLTVLIPAEDGREMQAALNAELSTCCERCGSRGAKPRLLYGWENRCSLHNAKGRREVKDEVPVTEV